MSEPEIFAIGDIVYLKSGSPKMTVNYVREQDRENTPRVFVSWFGGAKFENDDFPPGALTKTDPSRTIPARYAERAP